MAAAGWLTVAVVGLVLVMLATTHIAADLVMLAGLTVLVIGSVLSPEQALQGFANAGVITIAVLLIVTAGLKETGFTSQFVQRMLGRSRSLVLTQLRLVFPVAFASAFLNNTPLVAMLLPVVIDWARKNDIPPSKLLIPLSYAAILGGMCTVIGTSTNLVVNGLLLESGLSPRKLFGITALGLPCAAVGMLYLVLIGRRLLPGRRSRGSGLENPREYTVEMVVQRDGPLVGKTLEEAGVSSLPGLYVVEINREGEVIAAVSGTQHLHAGDQLVLVGVIGSVVDLQRIAGLEPATDQLFKLDAPRTERCLIEAVVSNTCPNVDRTIREGNFRVHYDAVVIAVARNGERIGGRIGDIVIRAGDVLLLEALPSFVDHHKNSRDFYLLSRVDDFTPPRHERAWLALAIFIGMLLATGVLGLRMVLAATIAAALMLLTRCCSEEAARRSVDIRLLVTIAAALGLGQALEVSGVAASLAGALVGFAGHDPWRALLAVAVTVTVLTELITNNAAAALVFPLARAAAQHLQVSFAPFVSVIMIGGSASFSTPIGYQTNLMVLGPGGYRFGDFFRVGIPLNLLIGALSVTLAPLVWPFQPR